MKISPSAAKPRGLFRPAQLAAGLLLATFSLGAAAHAATTYYVSSSAVGSTNEGTEANPWTSVATVNAHGAFTAGDRILFKRGDTFDGAGLVVQGSGAAGDPITYGAYPDNADPRPVIDGNGANCVTITSRNWITIQDLDLSSPNAAAPLNPTALTCNNGNNIEVRRVRSAFTAGSGLKFTQGGDILVAGCEVLQFGNGAIYLTGSDTLKLHDVTVQDCLVHDARDGTNADGITVHNTTAGASVGANFTILRNTAYNCHEQGFDLTSGTNILLEHNESYGNNAGGILLAHSASDVTIRYHYGHDEPAINTAATVTLSVPDVTIEYSKFVGPATVYDAAPQSPTYQTQIPNRQPLLQVSPAPSTINGVPVEHQPENFVLRNNVLVWNSTAGGNIFNLAQHFSGLQLTAENLTMKNNLFSNRSTGIPTLNFGQASRPPDYAGYQIINNLYDNAPATRWAVNGKAGSPFLSFAAYHNAYPFAGEISGDPLFVAAAAGDFHLQAGSPAIDVGEDVGLTTDFDGAAVPQGAGRDLGAFEFSLALAPPTGLTATALAPHEIQLAWTDNSTEETAFRLQRKEGSGGIYADTTPATVAANTTTFSDTVGVAGSTTYFYQVRAENADGTSAWSAEATATTPEADTIAPEITRLTATPDHLWPPNHKMVAVTLTATATDDKDPAPVTKILSVTSSEADPGEPDWAITGDLTLNLRAERAGNGPGRLYTITVQSTDNSGNSSTAIVLIPVGHNNDTKAPTVALTAPAGGALLRGSVALAATATDNNGVVGVQFQLDGANLGVEDSSEPYGLAWNTTAASNGNHTLTAVARDENGNYATSVPVTVFVDNAPPAVAVTAPAANSLLTGGGIVLSASATDNDAVAGVQFKIDGVALGAELTAAPYKLAWDSTTVADGSQTLTAVARDAAGNIATAAVTFTVDNTPPTVAIAAPLVGATIYGQASVMATANDSSGVAGVQFLLDGGALGAEDTTAPYATVLDALTATEGAHTLTAVARDALGNTAASSAVAVIVSHAPPPVILYEGETLPVAANSETVQIVTDANASGGAYHLLNAAGAGSFVTYTVNVTAAGTYNITTRITTRNNRGRFQLKIDGVNQGAVQDYFSAGSATLYAERDLGSVVLAAGTHSFRFECTGKNASAAQFKQGLDYLKLTAQ